MRSDATAAGCTYFVGNDKDVLAGTPLMVEVSEHILIIPYKKGQQVGQQGSSLTFTLTADRSMEPIKRHQKAARAMKAHALQPLSSPHFQTSSKQLTSAAHTYKQAKQCMLLTAGCAGAASRP